MTAVVDLASLSHYDELFGVDPALDRGLVTTLTVSPAVLAVAS